MRGIARWGVTALSALLAATTAPGCGGDDDSTAPDAALASTDGGAGDAMGAADAMAPPCETCPVCADGEIKIYGTIDTTPIDLDLEIWNYQHDALAAVITVNIREQNDSVDSFVIDYDRTVADIRGKTFTARGSLDLQLNAGISTSSCAGDGRNGVVVFSPSGDSNAQFQLTDFHAAGADGCAAQPIAGSVEGCWND